MIHVMQLDQAHPRLGPARYNSERNRALSLNPGTRLGPYEIHSHLGTGGMGEVYRATDTRLDRTVAIKVLPGHVANDPDLRQRFEREARAASSLNHPHICTLYDIGRQDSLDFLVMEYLEGETLADRLAREPFPLGDAVQAGLAILGALEALHRRGLVHRDIKPSNLFLTPHGVKLLDFGLARPIRPDLAPTGAKLTLPGKMVGTPQYMAPEALTGQPVDARADLFAAGALLYEMLTAKPPFMGEAIAQVIHAITHENPPVLSGSAAIAAVDRVIHRALAKKPEDRYQTAEAMAHDLRQTLLVPSDSGETLQARPMTRLIVLPFRVLRPDPDTDFLAFSLSDAITASLSGLQSLVVRSSLAASRFSSEAPDLKAIAEQVEVDIVLVGTLIRAGDRLRVSSQLLEARAGTVLWSHSSQVALGDIFQLQDDLAHRIVGSLSLPLTAREHALLKHDMPASAAAYEYYLRANQLSNEPTNRVVARDLYLRCVEDDPRYAPAWARLGRLYRILGNYGPHDAASENLERAEAAFKRALEINPELPLAHNLYAYLEVDVGRAQEAMLRLIDRARGRPSDPDLFAGLVHAFRYCGLLEASVAAHEQARRLDPTIPTSVCHSYWQMGDVRRAVETDLGDERMMRMLALILEGRTSEVIATLKKIEQGGAWRDVTSITALRAGLEGNREEFLQAFDGQSPFVRDPEDLFYRSLLASHMGETERALDALQRSVDAGFACFAAMARDPWLDPLRGHPRFAQILHTAEGRHREAAAAFLKAGGDRVLGLGTKL